ncbi:hypothetical protein AVEN_204410-1 [Araneus ventricosus]|uniref:Uncharacterized protein n=1 Tax=Araneus ventricosus TaxID=182803 RepID=A0A4Y2LSX4_ARAVE|nr:hypothetical protein AVEN_204410-1 [Araneus ventricosus]
MILLETGSKHGGSSEESGFESGTPFPRSREHTIMPPRLTCFVCILVRVASMYVYSILSNWKYILFSNGLDIGHGAKIRANTVFGNLVTGTPREKGKNKTVIPIPSRE